MTGHDFAYGQNLDALNVSREGLDRIVAVLREWHAAGDSALQFTLHRWGREVLGVAMGTDPFTGRPVTRASLFCLLSTTKALATLVMLHLHELGLFRWTDRVTRFWPAYGQGGKEDTTIEHVLAHRAGVPSLTAPWRLWPDVDHMRRLCERSTAEWRPGSAYGYHGGIFGHLVDELCRRMTGKDCGRLLREEIARPLGLDDCAIGIDEDQARRLVRLEFLEDEQRMAPEFRGMEHPPWGADTEYNGLALLRTSQPSGGGVASADHMAGVFDLVALGGTREGRTWWSYDTQLNASRPRNLARDEPPASPGFPGACWGLGFLVAPTPDVFGTVPPGRLTVGHAGASGSVVYADPELGLCAAFTINGILGRRHVMRYRVLGDLVRAALGDGPAPSRARPTGDL